MYDYRIDQETGALIFTPNVDNRLTDLEKESKEKDKIIGNLIERIEKLENKEEGN